MTVMKLREKLREQYREAESLETHEVTLVSALESHHSQLEAAALRDHIEVYVGHSWAI